MRDKYANKSAPVRFFHKYTGFIVASVAIVMIAYFWNDYESNQEFFESWSCAKINEYVLLDHSFGFTSYKELDDEQGAKLGEILKECKIQGEFINIPQG